MKNYSFLFILVFLTSQAHSQTMDLNSPQIVDLGLRLIAASAMEDVTVKEPIKGSVYLDDAFSEAVIITERGAFNPKKMRYNIYQDAMEFEMGGKLLLMDASRLIKSISYGVQVFVAADYPYKTQTVRGYLQQVYLGKYALYAKKNISYRSAVPPKALEAHAKSAEYLRSSDSYFLKVPDQKLVKVSSIKNILRLLPEKTDILKTYIKKEKLSNKDLKDMVRILAFADSL
ncbi:MAG: hypothetical protein ACI9IP_002573 [Arcticibacterium sp.]|jgi:hypothetical protein